MSLAALLAGPPVVVNLGLERFARELAVAGVTVLHVDWAPPAGGDPRLVALLDALEPADDDP
jgi:hypothetical protein